MKRQVKQNKFVRGAGDTGTTTLFGSKRRFSKSDNVFDVLGSLDELGSWMGLMRAKIRKESKVDVLTVQQRLFEIQAVVAGAPGEFSADAVVELEQIIARIEAKLSPRTGFVIPGETEMSALCDIARTVCRRAERAVVALVGGKKNSVDKKYSTLLAYLNRLSTYLYFLARQEAMRSGITEQRPFDRE